MHLPPLPSFRRNIPATARRLAVLALCLSGLPLQAQQISAQPVPPPPQMLAASEKLSPDDLSQLLAPIALYPDALVGLILPASTVPSDVVLGARFLKSNGNPDLVADQPWDDSVKSLVRYPEVLAWLDQNLEWTASVGEAFVEQPADVMNAIQALRAQAKAAGNLQDTPQQKVVQEEQVIRIVPADPEIIYVPQYDPQVVYVQTYSPQPLLTFGLGFAVGAWLNYDFDWNRRCMYRGDWRGWNNRDYNDWNHRNHWNNGGNGNQVNVVNINVNNAQPWQPSANGQRQVNQRQRNNNGNARYVNTRNTTSAPRPVVDPATGSAAVSTPGRDNPRAHSGLPRPSRLETPANGNGRHSGLNPARPGDPANTLPVTSDTIPKNPGDVRIPPADRPVAQKPDEASVPTAPKVDRRHPAPDSTPLNSGNTLQPTVTPTQPGTAAPAASPEGRRHPKPGTVPTAAPLVPGQLSNPSPRTTPADARPSKRPDRSTSPETPSVATPSTAGPAPVTPPPQVAPSGERVKRPTPTKPTEPSPESPQIKEPRVRPVTQAPEIKQQPSQPRQSVERQTQVQEPRQQPQPQVPQQPRPQRQQVQEPPRVQQSRQPVQPSPQRQQNTERATAPTPTRREAPAAERKTPPAPPAAKPAPATPVAQSAPTPDPRRKPKKAD